MAAKMASTGGADGQGTVRRWLSEVFAFDRATLNWPRGVLFLDIAMVPLIVFWAIGHEEYLLSALFGAFLTIVADPGGPIGRRVLRLASFAVAGAGVTAFGFSLDAAAWGWLVLASFVVTLAASACILLGVHVFVGGVLLNVWFIVTVAVGQGLHEHPKIDSQLWAQVVTWTGGSALWIAVAFVTWLVGGRSDAPQPLAEIPADTTRRKLSPPLIAFAVLRAVAIAGAMALAFGLDLPYGAWLAIATIVALKPDLEQSTVASAQRVIGALGGALAAGLLLLIPAHETGTKLVAVTHGLEVVAIVLIAHAAALRIAQYALYTAAVAMAVLTLVDLPQPGNYSAEGYRVAWTVSGVAIGIVVMALAGLLAKRRSGATSQ